MPCSAHAEIAGRDQKTEIDVAAPPADLAHQHRAPHDAQSPMKERQEHGEERHQEDRLPRRSGERGEARQEPRDGR
jgi:hypothetical protein